VAAGSAAITQRIAELRGQGVAIAVVDALSNDDLLRLGPALKDLPLLTAGSGVAIGLPANFGLSPSPRASRLPPPGGWRAVVSGSCSLATNRQVRDYVEAGGAAFALDTQALLRGADVATQAIEWARERIPHEPVLVYSTASTDDVKALQAEAGVQASGEKIEQALAQVARGLVESGVRQLLVAGGETSGACVQALGITQLQIGPQIDPGVPWCHAETAFGGVHLALKSGNFGTDDFFRKAWGVLA
jgi:uncharacterized protein YgbK (DUF1537 family)